MADDYLITTLVTEEMLDELCKTEEMVALYGKADARLNDRDHYGAAVLQLEALANSVMMAMAKASLLEPGEPGARFRSGCDSAVMLSLDRVVEYLRADARNLMRFDGGALSRYDKDHSLKARNLMASLHGSVVADIRWMAANDLNTIKGKSARQLVAAAKVIAQVASRDDVVVAGVMHITPADEARCSVIFDNGNRCSKPAGHRPKGSDDPHVVSVDGS